jgi:hypothetical protein
MGLNDPEQPVGLIVDARREEERLTLFTGCSPNVEPIQRDSARLVLQEFGRSSQTILASGNGCSARPRMP